MDPQYFTHTLTLYEAELFVRGLQRRKRIFWEQARYIAYHTLVPYAKSGFSLDDMRRFSWEDSEEELPMSEEEQQRELEALRKRAELRDKEWMKLKGNGRRNVSKTPS